MLIDRGYRVVVHPAPYFLSYTNELSPEDVSIYRDKTYEVIVTRRYVFQCKMSYTAIGRHIYKRLKCVSSMRKKWQHYSAEECLRVLRDYYSSGLTKGGCCRKYGIRNKSTLTNWLRKYEFHPELLSLRTNPIEEDMANRDKESYKEENAALKKRIKELEKALAFSRLETEARDLMIDKAESYFNIPIRKKSGSKQ